MASSRGELMTKGRAVVSVAAVPNLSLLPRQTEGFSRAAGRSFEIGDRHFNGTRSVVSGVRSIQTGNSVWEYIQTMEANGGLVFIDQDSGVFTALDGKSSKHLGALGPTSRAGVSKDSYGDRQAMRLDCRARRFPDICIAEITSKINTYPG
jgi:hypothetical protein